MATGVKLVILVVEDDPNDIALLERAFRKAGVNNPVHFCRDGQEAKSYISGEGQYSDREKFPFPRLLITDLKMPRCNGFELLRWVRQHPQCKVIPAIVLSASAQDQDVNLAYELGANCYFCKPLQMDRLVMLVELASKFWSEALLPEIPGALPIDSGP